VHRINHRARIYHDKRRNPPIGFGLRLSQAVKGILVIAAASRISDRLGGLSNMVSWSPRRYGPRPSEALTCTL
jgi:hypothetical protein